MSRAASTKRIDYVPSRAAQAAIEEAATLVGTSTSMQTLLDRLVVWGLWCVKREQDRPPPLRPVDRETLPGQAVRNRASRDSGAIVPGATSRDPGKACAASHVCSTMPAVDTLKTLDAIASEGVAGAASRAG